MQLLAEHLGPALTKWHLNHNDALSPELPFDCKPAIHQIGIDTTTPHDHSWDFTTFVMCGGYEEEVYELIAGSDSYCKFLRQRLPGQAYYVQAETVHRIVRLLDGPCFTMVLHGPLRRQWRYFPEVE